MPKKVKCDEQSPEDDREEREKKMKAAEQEIRERHKSNRLKNQAAKDHKERVKREEQIAKQNNKERQVKSQANWDWIQQRAAEMKEQKRQEKEQLDKDDDQEIYRYQRPTKRRPVAQEQPTSCRCIIC